MNRLYNSTRYLLQTGGQDWRTLNLRMFVFGGQPDYDETDLTLDDIMGRNAQLLGISQAILAPTVMPDGTGQTSAVVVPSVLSGSIVTWMVLGKFNVVQNDSPVVLFIDDAHDLPYTSDGLDIVIQPDWLQQRGWFKP